ncbi:hypothetical protein SMC26_29685 [Actinomadura fulvescens]|uniref:Lipoprotein n=1 Tax=Actinomadura fulvescens TaxID=46160 RepID=A0ABP6CZZ2_9ACTN
MDGSLDQFVAGRGSALLKTATLLLLAVVPAAACTAAPRDDGSGRPAATATPSPSGSPLVPTVAGMRITYLPTIANLARQPSAGGDDGRGWKSLVASWTSGGFSKREEVVVIVFFGKAVKDLDSFVAAAYPGTKPPKVGRVHGKPAVFPFEPQVGRGFTSLAWVKRPGVGITVAVRGTNERAKREARKIAEGVQGEPEGIGD